MAKLKVEPTGKVVEIEVGESILEVSKRNNLGILFRCNGIPACAQCRVKVLEGEEFLSPITRTESELVGTAFFMTRYRLSCQAKLERVGDLTIDISEHEELRATEEERKKIREEKAIRERQANMERREKQRQEMLNRQRKRGLEFNEDEETFVKLKEDAESEDQSDDNNAEGGDEERKPRKKKRGGRSRQGDGSQDSGGGRHYLKKRKRNRRDE